MRSIARRWRAVLLALPLAGALGFGATQALASPAADPARGRECVPEPGCWKACPFAGGIVTWQGDCMCCEY
jgi:hypothetical protein